MLLAPDEYQRLAIFSAAELARRLLRKHVLLERHEAVALIADDALDGAREGLTHHEIAARASRVVTRRDVRPGVAEALPLLQVEASIEGVVTMITIIAPIRGAAGHTGTEAKQRLGRENTVPRPRPDALYLAANENAMSDTALLAHDIRV